MNEQILDDTDLVREDDWPVKSVIGFCGEPQTWEFGTFPDLVEAIGKGR
jgi:hypothetical protein